MDKRGQTRSRDEGGQAEHQRPADFQLSLTVSFGCHVGMLCCCLCLLKQPEEGGKRGGEGRQVHGGGACGTLATAGSCLDIMVWNWVVFMLAPLSAALWNSVTSVLMASSNSEY